MGNCLGIPVRERNMARNSENDITPPQAPLETPDEPDVLQNDLDDLPTFYETIPTLEDMSSTVIAIALWRRVLSLPRNSTYNSFAEFDCEEVEKSLLQLPLPRVLRENLKNYLTCVEIETKDFFSFHTFKVFPEALRRNRLGNMKLGDLLFCQWLPDGKIDYKTSALNMLSNPRLTKIAKFIIMCRYCLEDEIEKLSAKSLSSYSSFTKNVDFNEDPLVYYWLCYKKKNLNKIPKRNHESVALSVISTLRLDTWSAIEYFWHRLKVKEQTSTLDLILNRWPHFQKNLFDVINKGQKFDILAKIPIKIMDNFWNQPGQEKFAVSTWIYISKFVDYENFYKIMRYLTFYTVLPRVAEKGECFIEILEHSPDDLKKFLYEAAIVNIIANSYECFFRRNTISYVAFLNSYLADASTECRKKIMLGRAKMLRLLVDPSITNSLIKLCFPDAPDVDMFKEYMLNSCIVRKELIKTLNCADFEKINKFLDYYCPNSEARSIFCARILKHFRVTNNPNFKLPECAHNWIRAIQFVDLNLRNTFPKPASKLRKIIQSRFVDHYCDIWVYDDKIEKMIQVVTEAFDPEILATLKLRALERVRACYKWGKFDENFITAFLLWCCNDNDQMVKEFKKTLPIDKIFQEAWLLIIWQPILKTDVDQETVLELLRPLDNFLMWYFEDAEDVKKFKLKKIFAYCDKGVSMYPEESNDFVKRNTLPWFFEGDQNAIESFRKTCKDADIGQMI